MQDKVGLDRQSSPLISKSPIGNNRYKIHRCEVHDTSETSELVSPLHALHSAPTQFTATLLRTEYSILFYLYIIVYNILRSLPVLKNFSEFPYFMSAFCLPAHSSVMPEMAAMYVFVTQHAACNTQHEKLWFDFIVMQLTDCHFDWQTRFPPGLKAFAAI